MNRKLLTLVLSLALCACLLAGCAPAPKPAADAPEEKVTLTIAGSWADCRAMDEAANAFTAQYPNCTIVYEYVQDYYASLEKRMSGDNPVDLFMTTNIQEGNALLPYTLELKGRADLDLSQTFDGLIDNFTYYKENSDGQTMLYALPLGAEMRGLYVNVTLLSSLGLKVPTDQASLLAACEKLKESGYIPFHGNPGNFAQLLVYPWICSLIANAEDPKAAYDRVNTRQPGLSEMFQEPYEFLYALVENGYYDYKKAQTEWNLFTDTTDEAYARDFLSIRAKEGEDGTFEKADDVGRVAFMPSPMSMQNVVNKTKEDYHSEIEYVFIPAPIGTEGGYVYLSPAHGIAVGKNSAHVDWCVKFLNFLFQPGNNEAFAKSFNIIPNTKEAFAYIKNLYSTRDDHIVQVGQVTFDYGFYNIITKNLTEVSKGNNPKYMLDDGSGNLSLYPLSHYMEELEVGIAEK